MGDRRRLMNCVKKEFFKNESGAVAVYVAIGIVVFLGFAALTMDIAHLMSVKRELAKAAEAGALSGARGLWPQDLSTAASRDPNCTNGASVALATTTKNRVESANLITGEVTAEVGRWDYATKVFTPGNNSSANGVRVTTHRNNVQMFLAQVLGQTSKNMQATAVAVMDFANAVGKGSLPIAVNLPKIGNPNDVIEIRFGNDNTDNGGWFAIEVNANASTLKDYIANDSCPAMSIGDTLNLNNGQVDAALKLLAEELLTHPDGWVVLLPEVSTPKYNQTDQIEAFVPIKITKVEPTGGDKYIRGTLLHMAEAAAALPGGGKSGALAPPKLVQ